MKDGICRSVDCSERESEDCLAMLLIFCFWFHRVNVGGKLLTNHLKEIISYR